MDWERIEGDWARLKVSAKRQWDKLTDVQLDAIAGKRGALSDAIREAYGITPETTERQVSFWQSIQRSGDAERAVMMMLVATTVLALTGFAHGADVPASPMSKAEYDHAKKDMESDYKGSRIGCEPMPAGVKETCLADVASTHEVALAELEHGYAPSARSQYELRIVKARAAYFVARRKCEERAGIARHACLEDIEAASAATRIDAAAQLRTAEAGDAAKARAKAAD